MDRETATFVLIALFIIAVEMLARRRSGPG